MNFKTILIALALLLVSGPDVSAHKLSAGQQIEPSPQQTNPDCKYPPCD